MTLRDTFWWYDGNRLLGGGEISGCNSAFNSKIWYLSVSKPYSIGAIENDRKDDRELTEHTIYGMDLLGII